MAKKLLKATSNAEILSYFINQNPEVASEIDLPVQGQSTAPIGQIIMDNQRYKNLFINTVNLIGLTVIKENRWENPWDIFTNKGSLRFGQQIREIILDLAKVHDFNEFYEDKDKFLDTEVPDVYQYIHQINFQKWYEVTVNDAELQLAFLSEDDGLYKFIENTIANLYESYKYDKYLVDKYQLCRRIVDGTITSKQIPDYNNKTAREVLSYMKGISNKMAFRSPNYNPAGVRRATRHEDQYLLIDAMREGINSTEVLATSYFLNEADVKTNLALIDSFSEQDTARLSELLGSAYVPFTDTDKAELEKVIGITIANDFFMDYFYMLDGSPEGKKQTEFMNPVTLDRNVFLHTWLVVSTSPFANACVFVTDEPAVSSVSVTPSTATVSAGQEVQLKANVTTTGFANKSVQWSIEGKTGASVDVSGKVAVASNFDNTGSGTAGVYDIEITTILETGDILEVNGLKYTVDATTQDTIAKQITALKSVLNVATITDEFTIGGSSPHCTLTEKSGHYGLTKTPVVTLTKASGSSGAIDFETTTEGALPGNILKVTATSIYDETKSADSVITVA